MNGTAVPPLNEWVHIACVYDVNNMAYIYINGEVDRERGTTGTIAATDASVYLGTRSNTAGTEPDSWNESFFDGMLDDVRFYDHALEQTKLESIMAGEEELPSPLALMPAPADGEILKETWATLSWEPGYFAASHDVYFGDNFDDVNDGTGETFRGNQGETYIFVGFPGFPFPDGLELGTTYYWRIDEINDVDPNSPWKGDVWSFSIAPKTAYNPNPPDDAEFVDPNVELSWSAGFGAILHTVYIGDDFDDVDNATGGSQQGTTTYKPGPLGLEKVYYWRVDEFDAAATYKGDIWSFTTVNFLVVDNFEDYNDYPPDDIFSSWKDGYGIETNGALIGYDEPDIDAGEHFVETTIVHSGDQSMPYFYNNVGTANYSEAGRTLDGSGRDWTAEGVVELSLWFRGLPASVGSFVEGPVGTYTITGSGSDIWGTSDEFHFAFKQLEGIGSITAKVESVSDTNPWAKAGVMIRESLEPGSKHAIVCLTPGNGIAFQGRLDTDSDSFNTDLSGITAPYWVKLERQLSGDFIAYHSTDGSTWEILAIQERILMDKNVYIGLAVTAHNAETMCKAIFSNVTIAGTVGSQWTNQDIGIISNDAEPMYVAVSNTAGDTAVVYHDDPNAAQIDTWTEWVIPLQEFAEQGVDLTDVDKIAIGFGTKDDMTTVGGSGTMYFDDILLYRPR
ncbi:MAG: LamG domain-containing protein, partial [Sedimentisphaerales bacterium]